MNKKAFTVLEIILVLVIISILSAIVLPQFSLTRQDAQLSKTRADISAIRMGILLYRNKQLLSGKASYPPMLDNSEINTDNVALFNNGVLAYPIYSISAEKENKSFSWSKIGKNMYQVFLNKKKKNKDNKDSDDDYESVFFTYDDENGTFDCDFNYENCQRLVQ